MGARKKPWDRQKGESDKAYETFSLYLEMEARSIQKVADRLAVSRQNIEKLVNKFAWRERAAAYDSSIVEAIRKEKIKRKKKFLDKIFTVSELMIDNATEFFEKHNNLNRCSFRAATEMADIGCKLAFQSLELDSEEETATGDKTLTINIVRAGEGDGR